MAYSSREDTGFFRTIHADLRSGDLRQTIGRDYTSLRDYALSEGQRRQLPGMSTLRRWFVVPWWILKRLFFALTPARRLLVLVGSLLIIASHQTGEHQNGIALAGALLLMFVLLLELKDKLAAREELDAGHAVQKALQPEESPRFPGWDLWLFTRPANEVGAISWSFSGLNMDGERWRSRMWRGKGSGPHCWQQRFRRCSGLSPRPHRIRQHSGPASTPLLHARLCPGCLRLFFI